MSKKNILDNIVGGLIVFFLTTVLVPIFEKIPNLPEKIGPFSIQMIFSILLCTIGYSILLYRLIKKYDYDRKILINLGLEVSRFDERHENAMWGRPLSTSEIKKYKPQLNLSPVQFNDTWAQWLVGLLTITENSDIDYYNFGEYYFFYEIISGKIIEIPTGKKAKNTKTRETIKPGMVLFLMEK